MPVIASMSRLPLAILCCICGFVRMIARKLNQQRESVNNRLAEATFVASVTCGVTRTVKIVMKKIKALGLSKFV